MKTCSGCKLDKPISDFTKRKSSKDGHNSRCKTCTRAMSKSHFDRNSNYYRNKQNKRRKEFTKQLRILLRKLKSKPCADCNNCFHFSAMDFDHIRGKKKFEIGKAASNTTNMQVVLNEIAKCELVCANCHRVRTYKRRHKLP